MERAVRSVLVDDATVSGLVGSRIYPTVAPATAGLPYVVYQRISTNRVRDQGGVSDLAQPRIQVSCWADSYSGTKTLADAVRAAIDGYRGTAGPVGSQTAIRRITCENETDAADLYPEGSDNRVFGTIFDFMVWHAE